MTISTSRLDSGDIHSLDRLQQALAVALDQIGSILRDEREAPEVRLQNADRMLERWVLNFQGGEFRYRAPNQDIRGGLAHWQICRVQAYIECHLTRTIRIQELADISRLSRFHFSRAFRESLQQSPHNYVMWRRLARAGALMLTTRASLCEIALECGLTDQAHLNRLFRKLLGETPAHWRRTHAPLEC